jgi:serine/threonine-protein kinase
MTSIFISYRRQPSAMLATLLARELKARGIEVYVDTQRLDSAGAFPERLKEGIQSSDVFICLVGDTTFESEWVREEIKTALQYGKPMIPVFQESYQQGGVVSNTIIKQFLDYDGILIFDVKNVYIDQSIDVLARMIGNTAAQLKKASVATTTPNPNINLNDLAGQTLGQYQLQTLVGMGGMGAVYRATQVSLNRAVAVKVLAPSLAAEASYAERFSREAQIAATLEHPNIVPVYDYGSDNGLNYVVMRYLTGGSLADRMEKVERPTLAETVSIIERLAAALHHAHSQGIVHRDIKASNVMFDEHGTPFLVDFGIAKLLGSASGLTGTGVMMGTPLYMAPEQWRAEGITAETDQYALGVLAYGMITGHMPFNATTPYALMQQHINDAPPPPTTYRQDLPAALQPVLDRALAKEAPERYPSITAFAQALATAAQGGPAGSPPSTSRTTVLPTLHGERTRADPLPDAPTVAADEPNGRSLLVIWLSAAAVIVIGLIIVGIVATQPGGFLAVAAPTATATNLPAATLALTSVPPTEASTIAPTATIEPGAVPTLEPITAPTLIPPTQTATLIPPTSTATITLLPSTSTILPTNVLLIYDDAAFTLHNQSGDILSLEGVIFRSANGSWEARSWGESIYTSLPDNDCLRLRDAAVGNRQPPAICGDLYGLQIVGPAAHFWRNVPSFEVARSGVVLAVCSVTESSCAIHIPTR